MAEGRMLKKRISKSRKFAGLKNDKARLLYLMILPHVDAEGRLEADAGILKGTICPYIKTMTQIGIKNQLKQLNEAGLIVLYSCEEEWYLQISRFEDFNRINKAKEANSCIPAPTPAQLQQYSGGTPSEEKLREVKRREVKVRGFQPPTLQEIQNYIKEKNYPVDAKQFFDFFEAGDWHDTKGNKVKSWKQKIITWSKFDNANPKDVDSKLCIVCQAPGDKYQPNDRNQKIWLCTACRSGFEATGRTDHGHLPLDLIEKYVLEGKSKQGDR